MEYVCSKWRSDLHANSPSSLPGLTNRLVSEVIAANPNTIVVNQSGTPVEMPWIDEAHTLLQVRTLCVEVLNYLSFTGILRRKRSGQWPG